MLSKIVEDFSLLKIFTKIDTKGRAFLVLQQTNGVVLFPYQKKLGTTFSLHCMCVRNMPRVVFGLNIFVIFYCLTFKQISFVLVGSLKL